MAAVDRVSQQTGRPCVALTPFPAFLSLHSVVSCHQSRAKGLSGTPDTEQSQRALGNTRQGSGDNGPSDNTFRWR